MCGITGMWTTGLPADRAEAITVAMRDRLRHRGPDDAGIWIDAGAGICLGQRRLAILDLSPLGHQPMVSTDGRFVLDYNGEIYNYRDVAAELETLGVRLRGTSDTEVFVEAIARFGLREALERVAGMFACAVWDRAERRLSLVRDRLGIKPLYYGWWRGSLLFASELKAFDAFPGFAPELDREALALLLRHGYVPAPRSIWREVRKLPPGQLLECTDPGSPAQPRPWWSARDAAARGQADGFRGTADEAVDELERLLGHVTGQHMMSDVPLGAFLSGGIDSSVVVALMQAQSTRPVRTFTIGFDEDGFDEAGHARRVAEHLGTDHTELRLRSKDAEAVIPLLPEIWDEPFADPSQIPTYLVSRLARESVTVALSGDGGDELFGGYTRYLDTTAQWQRFCRGPLALRRLAAAALRGLPASWVDVVGAAVERGVARESVPLSERFRMRADIVSQRDVDALYQQRLAYWREVATVAPDARRTMAPPGDPELAALLDDPLERMMLVDSVGYLPDDILVKVDRASMAVSLEARVPLLDHRVFEFAWRLPIAMRVRAGCPKWPLRALLERHLPRAFFERPKQGFAIPLGDWLRGPLRQWCEALLAEDRLRREGYFDVAVVRRAWSRYLQGWPLEKNLWIVLMFQSWLERREAAGG